MTIQRRQKPFTFTDGRQIVVWEANWDISMARGAIEAQARDSKAKLNGSGDPELLYFHEMIFAHLAACATGDVPGVEQAFGLSPEELDGWYREVGEVNPGWFLEHDDETEEVEFRDGSKVIVVPAHSPSVLMRLHRLESAAEKGPQEKSVSAETFRILYYPRLAACSIGDVPTLEQARVEWPETELDKWYQAARRVNPRLFLPLEQIAEQNLAAATQAEKKRKKSRARSSSS